MPMIIAGGGAASVYTGAGTAVVTFTASGVGRQTGASTQTTVTPVQNSYACSGGASVITVNLPGVVTAGDFLTAAITLSAGSVVSITDTVAGYNAVIQSLMPVGWWKFNELSGTTAIDYGSGDNNGSLSGGITLGEPGPIFGTPSYTSYGFASAQLNRGFLGTGMRGWGFLGGGQLEYPAEVTIDTINELSFGTGSFTVAGWINGATNGTTPGYIFNDGTPAITSDTYSGLTGAALLGQGLQGGGLLATSNAGFTLQMNAGTEQLEFGISDNEGNVISLQTPLSYANSWHFVVGTVDRSAQLMHIYVDGQPIGDVSVESVGSVTNEAALPIIGEGVLGDLSQIFLCDYALTAAQVLEVYESSFVSHLHNRWIQAAFAKSGSVSSEIWYARGVQGGATTVTFHLSLNAQACAVAAEWSGVWYVDPLDQWSQNYGSGSVVTTQAVTPRVGSDLFLAAVSATQPVVSGATGGYTNMITGGNGGVAYYISPYDVAETTSWGLESSGEWAVAHASFVPGVSGMNPLFQFPETLVEIGVGTNFLAPLQGVGVWSNISRYVRNMDLGPLGRQHLLDRVEAATASFTVNNRIDGAFNLWNTGSFLYGQLEPMHPVKVTAAWNGITTNESYTYIQSVTQAITDVLNVDMTIACNDLLALLNLRYLSYDNFAQLVKADGGANLAAYYRLGDTPNSYSVLDSSGNGNTGSLINGVAGEPTFGATSVFLYDSSSALDCTSGTNSPNGGFDTNDQTTESPTVHNPLANAENWSFECWFQFTGGTTNTPAPAVIPPPLGTPITRPTNFPGGAFSGTAAASVIFSGAYAAVGDLAILGIVVVSPTVTVTDLQGITSGEWTLQVRNQDAVNSECVDIWTAPVTSIAAIDVVTVTYSDDTNPPMYFWTDSFTVGQGANTIWSYPDVAVNQSATHVTTAVYPALDADGSGNPQAYWGVGSSSGTMHGGTTPGFQYTDVSGSEITYNLDVFSGGNPWQPTTNTDSGSFVTVGMIVEASISEAASVAAIPNATLLHISTPNEFEPFTSYEMQVGFAEIGGDIPGTTSPATNCIVEAFGEYDFFNIYRYPTNPVDGGWHHLVKSSNLFASVGGIAYPGVPYLDGAPPTWGQFSTQITGDVSGINVGTQPQGVLGIDVNLGTVNAVPFAGIISDVALYITDLTPAQILNHYNTGLWFQTKEYGASVGGVTASRTSKVLAVAGLDPATFLVVPYPFLTLLYAESDTIVTTSALNYIQTSSETEPGLIYQAPDGLIHCLSREYQYLNPTSITSQALFSDSENSPYYYDGPTLALAGDDLDLWNDIQIQSGIAATATQELVETGVLQEWGPAQSALAATSASIYGIRTLQGLTSLQFAYDSDALAVGQNYLAWYALPIVRVTQMTINAQGNGGANIPQMLQRQIYDAVQVEYTGQTSGPTFSQISLIESITHNVNMDVPEWSTVYALSPYELLLNPIYLDSSTLDGPDVLTL